MKDKTKYLLTGFLAGAVFASFGVASASQTVNAIISAVSFKFDGVNKQLPQGYAVLNYEGRMYVPARFVAEELGAQVNWDASSQTISIIGPPKTTPPATGAPATPTTPPKEPAVETPKDVASMTDEEKSSALETELSSLNTLDTPMGKTSFEMSTYTNTTTLSAHDIWLAVKHDAMFFFDIQYSNKYTKEQKEATKKALKDHQKKIADACLKYYPNIKWKGGYYYSWYRYPNIKEGFESEQYFTWSNYEEPAGYVDDRYNATKASFFRWTGQYDDKL